MASQGFLIQEQRRNIGNTKFQVGGRATVTETGNLREVRETDPFTFKLLLVLVFILAIESKVEL